MNIAICEDNLETIGHLEKIVFDCFINDTDKFNCDTYLSGEELLNNIELNKLYYHLFILDIEMGKVSGLNIAATIRKTDHNAIIIFITSHHELMQEAFEVSAFHYLVKPINEEKTRQVFLKTIEIFEEKKHIYHYKIRKKNFALYFEQIVYFESYKRKIFIHTTEEVHEYYGTLKEVLTQVNASSFAQIHNSYVINMDYIKFTDASNISLFSGIIIPITKKYYTAFNSIYRNYIVKRML